MSQYQSSLPKIHRLANKSISFKLLLTEEELLLYGESLAAAFLAPAATLGFEPFRKALASLEVNFPESSDPPFKEVETVDFVEELASEEVVVEVIVDAFEVEFGVFSIRSSLRTSKLIFSEMFFCFMILSIASLAVAAGLSDFNFRLTRLPISF